MESPDSARLGRANSKGDPVISVDDCPPCPFMVPSLLSFFLNFECTLFYFLTQYI